MKRSMLWIACLMMACHCASAAPADPAAMVSRGKSATALVEVNSGGRRGFASAFCIDQSGIFVTNQHVVEQLMPGATLVLILDPGGAEQRSIPAKVLRTSKENDLALLRIGETKGLISLELGAADTLIETTPLTAFGYPFGRALAGARDEYPSITVSTGRVTSLRKVKGELQAIQLDASLNPGNSGGPVLDADGKVVGIVARGIPGSGVNFAVPVTLLRKLLIEPDVLFQPSAIALKDARTAHDFTLNVTAIADPKTVYSVQMTLSPGGAPRQNLTAKSAGGGVYRVSATLLPPPAAGRELRLSATYSAGSISGNVKDIPCTVGDRSLRLGEISEISGGPKPAVVTVGGESVAGKISSAEMIEVIVGEDRFKLDLAKAARVQIVDKFVPPASIPFEIVVSDGTQVVARQSGTFTIESAPRTTTVAGLPLPGSPASVPGPSSVGPSAPATSAASLTPPPMKTEKEILKLPGPADDIVAGGSGRYLCLAIRRLNKIAIFDVTEGKIVRFISVPSDGFTIAAGAQKLLVSMPDQQLLQRWDLATGERELTVTLPDGVKGDTMAMGWASAGPLLLGIDKCIDIATLKLMKLEVKSTQGAGPDRSILFRASGDGTTFGGWRTETSPAGLYVGTLSGNKISWNYEHSTPGYVAPSFDGTLIFTGIGVVKRDSVKLVNADRMNEQPQLTIGAYDPNFYVAWKPLDVPGEGTRPRKTSSALSIYSTEDQRLLLTLNDLTEISPEAAQTNFNRGAITLDRRIHFFPSANLLVTLASGNDQLVLRKLNVLESLEKMGIDYFLVRSTPLRSATRGSSYVYRVEAVAKKGGITFKLESGPEGMTIGVDGTLRWSAPASGTEETVGVIVSLRDAAGQEIYHSFKIGLRDP